MCIINQMRRQNTEYDYASKKVHIFNYLVSYIHINFINQWLVIKIYNCICFYIFQQMSLLNELQWAPNRQQDVAEFIMAILKEGATIFCAKTKVDTIKFCSDCNYTNVSIL